MATIHTRGEECAAGLAPAMCVMCALTWAVPAMSAMAVGMAGCERPAVGETATGLIPGLKLGRGWRGVRGSLEV